MVLVDLNGLRNSSAMTISSALDRVISMLPRPAFLLPDHA